MEKNLYDGILEIDGKAVAMKRLDKVYCKKSGVLKAEIIDYYLKNAGLILPHIADKPFSMIHFPEGIGGKFFYQKQVPDGAPDWLKRVTLPSATRETIDWSLVNDAASICYMANRSVIEMHTWFSRLPDLGLADIAVIDLDPSGNTGFNEARIIAKAFHVLLDELNLFAVPKTSGSRGIHICIPIERSAFDQVQGFLTPLCKIVAGLYPDLATTERVVRNRGDRIYLDAVQNGEGKTIIAPYSLRAREGVPFSAPLLWEELDDEKLSPRFFHVRNFEGRLGKVGDLFKDFYARAQPLPKL